MRIEHLLHLHFVGTCHYGHRHTCFLQLSDELQSSGNIIEDHVPLQFVNLDRKFLLLLEPAGQMLFEDLDKSLSLDRGRKTFHTEIFQSFLIPEGCILRFGIHHDTVEVKQCDHLESLLDLQNGRGAFNAFFN